MVQVQGKTIISSELNKELHIRYQAMIGKESNLNYILYL